MTRTQRRKIAVRKAVDQQQALIRKAIKGAIVTNDINEFRRDRIK